VSFNLPPIVYEIRSLFSLIIIIIFYFTLRRRLDGNFFENKNK
jgi:hypothetical protein